MALLLRRGHRRIFRLSEKSIEVQSCSIFIVAHASEIVSGIHVLGPVEEKLFEGPEGTQAQRIDDAAKCDLHEIMLPTRNGHEIEVSRGLFAFLLSIAPSRRRSRPNRDRCRRWSPPWLLHR